eukprot:2836634-Pyramimonas_sp.AAC.1
MPVVSSRSKRKGPISMLARPNPSYPPMGWYRLRPQSGTVERSKGSFMDGSHPPALSPQWMLRAPQWMLRAQQAALGPGAFSSASAKVRKESGTLSPKSGRRY